MDLLILGILVFLSQVIDVPGQTAKSVIIPSLIEDNSLPREKVNGMVSLVETGADLVGPILAGLLISAMGAVFVLLLDAATFVIAFVFISWGIRSKKPDKNKTNRAAVFEIWKWLLREKSILRLAIFDLVVNTVSVSLLSLTLPVIANVSDEQAVWLGVWLTFFAIGTTLTTATYTFLGHRVSPIRLLQFTPLGQAFGLLIIVVAFYYEISNTITSFGMFVYGINLGVGSVVDATILQQIVPADRRGTVFSLFSSLRFMGVPLGLLVSGFFLDQEQFISLFVVFAVLIASTSLLWFIPTHKLILANTE